MTFSPEARLTAVFSLSLAILLLLAWKTHLNNQHYQESFRAIEHTNSVILTAEQTASATKELERHMTDFLITNDSSFLHSFRQSESLVKEQIQSLQLLTADNEKQQTRIDSLSFYVEKRIGQLAASMGTERVDLKNSSDPASQLPNENNFKGDIANFIGQIKEEEKYLLKQRKTANAQSNNEFNTRFLSLVAVLIMILIGFFATLYLSYKKRTQAENLLKENKHLLQSIIDNTSSIIYLKDLHGKFILANRQFEKAFNLTKEQVLGKTVFDFWPGIYAVRYSEADQVVLEQKRLVEVEEDAEIDGRVHNFYSIKFPLYHEDGELYAVAGISTDITEIINKQQLVQQKEIAETTILAQEKERTEIGKELHDNVNQLLATARLMIETSITMPEMKDECMKVSKGAVEDAIKEIRDISHSMLPPPFEDEAFADAIKDIANNINVVGILKVEVQVPTTDNLSKINDKLKLSLYRIIQEQVSNMLKYSNAKTASIKLEVRNDHAHLSIVDNGIGADLGKRSKGVGLRNIASRVEIHNGELKIRTAPNKGFGLYTRFIIGNDNGRSIA